MRVVVGWGLEGGTPGSGLIRAHRTCGGGGQVGILEPAGGAGRECRRVGRRAESAVAPPICETQSVRLAAQDIVEYGQDDSQNGPPDKTAQNSDRQR